MKLYLTRTTGLAARIGLHALTLANEKNKRVYADATIPTGTVIIMSLKSPCQVVIMNRNYANLNRAVLFLDREVIEPFDHPLLTKRIPEFRVRFRHRKYPASIVSNRLRSFRTPNSSACV